MSPRSREDVVSTAGRLFAERGYHGTSMRDLGSELGLLGSSLYAHIDNKQQLLVEVIDRGAGFFQAVADAALLVPGPAPERLRALIAGHVGVVLDHRDEVRTFLNEARSLDPIPRQQVIDARDRYEHAFREVLKAGAADGSFRDDLDPVTGSIFILSVLNALERWYRPEGLVTREQLVDQIYRFSLHGIA